MSVEEFYTWLAFIKRENDREKKALAKAKQNSRSRRRT